MPSFAFESGYLVPASIGQPSTSPLTPDVRQALRDYLLDVIEADLFPVEWSDEEDPVLTAMDVAGQVVTAVVTDRLDGDRLLAALTRAGEATSTPWLTIAGRYRSGVGGFRRDWNAFRESRPPGAKPGPQLYVVAGEVTREVLDATRVLHGVQVFAVDSREAVTGQRLLDVTPVLPAAIRVLDGAVVHEIEPGISAVSPEQQQALSAPTPVAAPRSAASIRGTEPGPAAARAESASAGARTAEEPVEPEPVVTAEEPAELAGTGPMAVDPMAVDPMAVDPMEATAPTPETAPRSAAAPLRERPRRQAAFPGRARSGASAPEPGMVDPQLRAVAQLVGAPMPIELRHEGQVQHAVLTADGALQVGDATVATIERATELLGGEPSHAWTSWHVAGFPMAEARAEATGTTAPARTTGRRRAREH